MYNLHEYRRTPARLPDLLPWGGIVAESPCVIRNKDGSLQHTLAYQGLDLEARTAGELRGHAGQLNNVLKRLGSGWALHIEQANRRVQDYPESTWPNAASAAIDAERRAYFLDTPHYRMQQYLTILWKPPSVAEQRARRWLYVDVEDGPTADDEAIDTFQDQVEQFTRGFAGCMAWVHPLSPGETLTYLHQSISTSTHAVSVPEHPWYLDYVLSDRDYVGGLRPALVIGPAPENGRPGARWQDLYEAWHLRTLTIRGFPNESYPTMLAHLSTLPMEYRYVCRYLALDATEAYALMDSKRGWWAQMKTGIKQHVALRLAPEAAEEMTPDRLALGKAEAIEAAMDECAEGMVGYGYFTGTVTTWAPTPRQADEHLKQLEAAITLRGFTCQREGLNAVDAWLGSLPGHCYANVKRPLLNSMSVGHMLLGSAWTGPVEDTHLHAEAVCMAETDGKTPFNLVLHHDGVGHALIIGPTGNGKTTLVGFLGQQFLRYHAQGAWVRLFDKKGTLQPITQAMGGADYLLSGTGEGLAFQPLRRCDDLAERQWGASFLEGLLSDQHITVTPAIREDIWQTLTSLAAMPEQLRTLTGFMLLLQTEVLRQAIRPYTVAGAYGTCLDGVSPPLTLAQWARFETDALFRVPPLIAPTLHVLFHELDAGMTGTPGYLALDEGWKYLAHPLFAGKIEEYFRELRKLNVSVVLSSQDVSELLTSPLYAVIRTACPVCIFLPNRRALEPKIAEQYEAVGLNARQIELLATATPKKDYFVMTPDGCRIVDLALGPTALSVLTKGTV